MHSANDMVIQDYLHNRYKDFIMRFQNTVKQLSTFSKMIKRLRLSHYARVNILK